MEPSPQETQALAELMRREGRALRALARGLLGDSHAAEDVVQDAAVVALRAAPAERLGGWLRGVVRNLARMARRGATRRVRCEHAALDEAEAPSASEIAASSELLQRVAGAVHALDEPFRTVVVLRFLHGHEPAEIARALGVPLNTVRSRLQRGLARLRERLDGECGGRTAWAAPLLAVLGGASLAAPASAASVGVLVASGGTMKKVVLAGVGLLVLGLGIAALAGGGLAPWRSGGDAPAAAAVGTGGAAEPVVAPAAESRATERMAVAEDESGWVVRGRVMGMARELLPGLRLVAERFPGYETTGEPREREELVCDGGGRIEWRLEPPQGAVTLRFLCRQEGYRDWSPTGIRHIVLRGEAPPKDLVLSVAVLDATVRGRVIGRKGEKVPGAWVQGPHGHESTRCGPDGEFMLRTIPGMGLAGAPGRVAQQLQITQTLQGRDAPNVEIRLREGLTLGGSILDTEGRPVAGASIEVRGPMPGGTVSSDSTGRYELTCIDPEWGSNAFVVRHPEYLPAIAYVSKDATTLDVVLHRGAVVEGRVLGPGDVPVAGARVCVDESMVETTEAVTHDDGQFVLLHVAKGPRVLSTRASELGGRARGIAADHRTIVVPEDGRLAGLLVRLAEGRSIAGKVVDEAGAPIAGVGVGAEDHPRYDRSASRPAPQGLAGFGFGVTDAGGRFRIDDLPPRRLLLRARALRGYVDGCLELPATARGDGFVITLASAGGCAGTVVDARTKKPVERFQVKLFADHERPARFDGGTAISNARGEWRIPATTRDLNGEVWVEAWADGYRPSPWRKVAPSAKPDPSQLVLELEPAAAVTGRVLDRAGLPVVDAKVIPFDERLERDPDAKRREANDALARHATATSADGRFAIDGLPAGELTLRVLTRGRPAWADGPFALRVGATSERVIVLGDGVLVRGRLLDARGAPLAGRTVTLEGVEVQSGNPEAQHASTGADGAFAFGQRCPEGRFRAQALVAREDGVPVLHAAAVRAAGDSADVEVRPVGACSLVARLAGLDPLPPRATVGVTFTSSELGRVRVEAEAKDGVLRLLGLPRAELTVYSTLPEAGRTEQWYGSASVATAPDRITEATVVLRRRR